MWECLISHTVNTVDTVDTRCQQSLIHSMLLLNSKLFPMFQMTSVSVIKQSKYVVCVWIHDTLLLVDKMYISCPVLHRGNTFWLTWKNSLGQPPGWAQGKCIWWSAAPCGAAASRWGQSPQRAAAAASSACQGVRGGRRAACSPGRGARQSRSTTERERFTGESRTTAGWRSSLMVFRGSKLTTF